MRLRSLLLFSFVFVLLLPAAAHAAPVKSTLEVAGWLPYWRSASSTADVAAHLNDLTTINPFGYTVTTDGVLFDAMGVADDPWKTLIANAKAQKVRVIPTVMWSNASAIYNILSNSTTRMQLEDDVAALVVREGFDGIDIDFENKTSATKPYFSLFLKGLYQRMGPKWVYCTIESRTPLSSRYDGTPPKDASLYANDFVQINKYCDRVQIMAYDQGTIDLKLNAAANGPYAPVSDPLWVKKVMQVALQTISKRKLVLGIPTYGYEYALTPLASGFGYDILWSFDPAYATQLAAANNIIPFRNSAGELSFTYIPTTTPTIANVPTGAAAAGPVVATVQPFNMVTWSDAVSVAQKIGIARELGIRGISLFKFDGGEDQNIWNVLEGQ